MSRRVLFAASLALLAAAWAGCAHSATPPPDFMVEPSTLEESAKLGGEALAVRKLELRRARSDLVHFRETLETLQQRKDRNGQVLFGDFLDAYLGEHLQPLLRSEWQSQHAELAAVDAGIRLLEVEILVRMRDPRRAQQEMDEIARRYQGRESMLVDWPVGEQSTLGEALQRLADKKWRG
jgi:hypothetical protein